MLAMLGKWATTQDRVFFLGKSCSWTLLPGSTWLQTLIAGLYRCVGSCKTHFPSVKLVGDSRVLSRLYDAYQPPGRLQGTLRPSVGHYALRATVVVLVCTGVKHLLFTSSILAAKKKPQNFATSQKWPPRDCSVQCLMGNTGSLTLTLNFIYRR